MTDLTNFRAVYDDLTDEVMRSRNQFLPDHLRSWFEVLDTTPSVAGIVKRLQANQDIDGWMQKALATMTGMIGSGQLIWPSDREQALGMKLLLFRVFSEGKSNVASFGHYFIYVGNNINDNARAFIEQVFAPMARELRRLLERELSEIPAADRVVSLDHNSQQYADAIKALATLEEILQGSNSFPDPVEKERIIAEVSAGRRLLNAAKVRVGAIAALLSIPLLYLVKKFADAAIGDTATTVMQALEKLFGAIF